MGMIGRRVVWCSTAVVMVLVSTAGAQNDIEDPNSFPGVWYRIALDPNGSYVHGDGDGYADGTWYHYPQTGRWRQWFYNGPYDPNRMGDLNYQVYIRAVDPNKPTYAEVRFNWSTPAWSALGKRRPPLPHDVPTADLESQHMGSKHLYIVEDWRIGTVEPIAYNVVAGYNPEWISIDIDGRNAYVYRGAFHSSVPKDASMGACYDGSTGDCYTCYRQQCLPPYLWLGSGTSCPSPTAPRVFPVPVYRFWSPARRAHFFTAREREKEDLLRESAGVWDPEGVGYYALLDGSDPNSAAVHRFWSDSLGVYFYTMNEAEKKGLIENPAQVWTYDGVAFYAYPEGRQPAEAQPVYRFWSAAARCHFFTIDEAEKDRVIDRYAAVWAFEGIAWYAYAP